MYDFRYCGLVTSLLNMKYSYLEDEDYPCR